MVVLTGILAMFWRLPMKIRCVLSGFIFRPFMSKSLLVLCLSIHLSCSQNHYGENVNRRRIEQEGILELWLKDHLLIVRTRSDIDPCATSKNTICFALYILANFD